MSHMYSKSNPSTRMTSKHFSTASLLALLFLIILPAYSNAQGNLLITPRRVIFEGNKSSQEINLANTGQDSATYSVSFVQYRMTDNGTFEQIEEPDEGQHFADKMIRYFPRTVTLGPGEAQMVRMQLRRSSNMEPGEYRSHMYFRAVPMESALGLEEQLEDTTAIGIRLTPIFGITIPVIVRAGEVSAEVTLNNLHVENSTDSTSRLMLTFNRTGNKSVYGDLTVDYKPDGDAAIQVGLVRGISVYTPNATRSFEMNIKKPEGVDFTKGKLVIRYTNAEGNNENLLAEKELLLK